MSDFGPASAAQLAFLLAFVSSGLAAWMGASKSLASKAHWPVVLALAVGFGLAVWATVQLSAGSVSGQPIVAETESHPWFTAGGLDVTFSIRLDPLSAVMLLVVTGIGTCIAVFSSAYMHDDPGYARYFALMGLFVASMLLLVLAPGFLVLVAGWEGVGICSYLLVGYYYAKPSAAAAARKAFLITRLGDAAMILGIFLLWSIGGHHTNFDDLFAYIQSHPNTHGQLTTACLLLFCGAVGKSAQVPLYVWLPDAMEGPTPVSALIHAATMVTAGVYLLARCAPLFVLAPEAQLVVAMIGGATALLAGFLALGQYDLKRVLAYSTVSQLGFMFMALGTGGLIPPTFAVTAALFHLVTHAFFKALLFLGSGSVMHAMGGVIDMRRFGGLKTILPTTHITFLCGALALAGVPILSGFFSKDMILDALFEAAEDGSTLRAGLYLIILGVALLTAFLTAFYTFRAYFLTFHGSPVVPDEAGDHAHEGPAAMTVPLWVLAAGAVGAGLALGPVTHVFEQFVARTPDLVVATNLADLKGHGEPHFNWAIAGISSGVALIGVWLAYLMYGKGGPEELPAGVSEVFALSRSRLYVDEVYHAGVVQPAEVLAVAGRQTDLALDGVARLVSGVPRAAAAVLRPLQNGLVQFYALGMVLGVGVFLAVVIIRSSR